MCIILYLVHQGSLVKIHLTTKTFMLSQDERQLVHDIITHQTYEKHLLLISTKNILEEVELNYPGLCCSLVEFGKVYTVFTRRAEQKIPPDYVIVIISSGTDSIFREQVSGAQIRLFAIDLVSPIIIVYRSPQFNPFNLFRYYIYSPHVMYSVYNMYMFVPTMKSKHNKILDYYYMYEVCEYCKSKEDSVQSINSWNQKTGFKQNLTFPPKTVHIYQLGVGHKSV